MIEPVALVPVNVIILVSRTPPNKNLPPLYSLSSSVVTSVFSVLSPAADGPIKFNINPDKTDKTDIYNTITGEFEEVIEFSEIYKMLVESAFPTVTLIVPVLTHKRSWASKRFTKPILFRLSNR